MRTPTLALCLASITAITLGIASCGGADGTTGTGGVHATTSTGGASAGGHGGGSTSFGGTGGDDLIDSGAGCNEGDPCGDGGGICTNGACCETGVSCAGVCCGAGQVCSFQKCETPGADCVDASDCAMGFYCDYSLGETATMSDAGACQGGAAQQTGKCLPKPPECAPGQDPGDPITCLAQMRIQAPPAAFTAGAQVRVGRQVAAGIPTT